MFAQNLKNRRWPKIRVKDIFFFFNDWTFQIFVSSAIRSRRPFEVTTIVKFICSHHFQAKYKITHITYLIENTVIHECCV